MSCYPFFLQILSTRSRQLLLLYFFRLISATNFPTNPVYKISATTPVLFFPTNPVYKISATTVLLLISLVLIWLQDLGNYGTPVNLFRTNPVYKISAATPVILLSYRSRQITHCGIMEFPLWYRSITSYTWLAGHSKLTMVLQPGTGRRAVPATQALQSWLQGLSRPQASQHFNRLFSWNAPPTPYTVLLV